MGAHRWVREQPAVGVQGVLCWELRRVPWGLAAPRRDSGGFVEEATLMSSEGWKDNS